jgi:hypothetical protein
MEVTMARTAVAKKTRTTSPRRNTRRNKSSEEKHLEIPMLDRRMTMKSFMNRIRSNPVAMYLGGSVAAVLLVRWGYHFYKDHPEIKEFILDNFDTVEDKLKEYKNSFGSDMSEARH